VIAKAGHEWSAESVIRYPPASIKPTVTGTRPSSTDARQRAPRKRCQILETAKVSTHEGPQTAAVATAAPAIPRLSADEAEPREYSAGRCLGEREELGELRARSSIRVLHDAAMHLGKHGDRAPPRSARERRNPLQAAPRASSLTSPSRAAAAMLKGAAPSRNTTRGRRTSAIL